MLVPCLYFACRPIVSFDILFDVILYAVSKFWPVESDVLFESHSGLHKLGIGVLKLTINETMIFPNVLVASDVPSSSAC